MDESAKKGQQIKANGRIFYWGLNHQYGNYWREGEPPAVWITSGDGKFEVHYQLQQSSKRAPTIDIPRGFPLIPKQLLTSCSVVVPRWDDKKPTTSLVRHILDWWFDQKKDIHPACITVRAGTDDDGLHKLLEQFHGLPYIKALHLHSVGMSDSSMNLVSNLRSLHTLSAIRGSITDAGMTCLESLRNLKSLSLSKIGLTDEGLKHVRQCQKLKQLWLIKTSVSDAGLDDIAALNKLSYIDLTGTLVTAEGRQRLRCVLRATVLPED
jgi:hypothetical protein